MKSMRAPSPLLLLLALTAVALPPVARAAVAIGMVDENPMYPRHCKDEGSNKYYADGSTWYNNNMCIRKSCRFPYINYASCSPVAFDPVCTLVTDQTLQYPGCCPQPRCPSMVDADNALNTI